MSKFKPGALVMLTNSTEPLLKRFIGTPRVLGEKGVLYQDCWRFDPPIIVAGSVAVWPEHMMKLIDPGEAPDEMLLITGLPERKGVAA